MNGAVRYLARQPRQTPRRRRLPDLLQNRRPAARRRKECTFIGVSVKSPFFVEQDSAKANKAAHYLLRWQYRDGSLGAFSETASKRPPSLRKQHWFIQKTCGGRTPAAQRFPRALVLDYLKV